MPFPWLAAAVAASAGAGMWGARQQRKGAEAQAEQQMEPWRAAWPYQERQLQAYTPYYEQAMAGAQEMLSPEIQPWEQQAIADPFEKARQMMGIRAAGAGTLSSGATQQLATLYDIAQAEAMARLPYERRMQAMGPATGMSPGMPTMPTIPAPYQPQQLDYAALGQMMAMIPQAPSMPGMIQGGVGGQTFTGPQIPGGTAWSPYT